MSNLPLKLTPIRLIRRLCKIDTSFIVDDAQLVLDRPHFGIYLHQYLPAHIASSLVAHVWYSLHYVSDGAGGPITRFRGPHYRSYSLRKLPSPVP